MRKLFNFLVNHVKEDFHLAGYAGVFIFLSVCILLNYTFEFEDSFLNTRTGLTKALFYFLTHAVGYFIPAVWLGLLKKGTYLNSGAFWLRSILALALLSLDRSMVLTEQFIISYVNGNIYFFAHKIIFNLSGVIFIILPLYIFYQVYDKQSKNFYGLALLHIDWRPYFLILLALVPVVVIASFLPGFQHQYPMYDSGGAHLYLGIPEIVTAVTYEVAYAFNFITIEFFYRGFLVLGMVSVLGRSAILPMACLYCFLHFGKPIPEAISSIFGGYVLGIIAYETKSIWGGILVHIGLAWLMEAAGYFQDITSK